MTTNDGAARRGSRQPVKDARATEEALLGAAVRIFAAHGFDAASVRTITAEAGATLGAITYHFGSKEGLYDRVIESCMVPLADRVVAAAGGGGAPLDGVERVVRAYMEHLLEHPEIPRLVMHQLLAVGTPPRGATASIGRIQKAVTALIVAGQAEGTIRAGHPVLLAISVLSHPLHLAVVRGALQQIAGLDLDEPRTRAASIANAVTLARRGLAVGGDGGER